MLTPQQQATLDFIRAYYREHQRAPTLREISAHLRLSENSRGVAHRYVQALITAGYLRHVQDRKRNLLLVNSEEGIPLLGSIAAGEPIEAISQPQTLDIIGSLVGPNRFALRVKGDSMIEEGIFHNDIVICEQAVYARDGQIVVALIDNQAATLKRLQYDPETQHILLLPANVYHQPQSYAPDRVSIQGIFIGLLRLPLIE